MELDCWFGCGYCWRCSRHHHSRSGIGLRPPQTRCSGTRSCFGYRYRLLEECCFGHHAVKGVVAKLEAVFLRG
ncbi:hypothetical protein QWZ13_09615 [Reinekea marina]|uniref:hypothetical protein n=1 Tax=Reinekea marina TaxID=1310421 RepID=UPI0025B4F1FF|nr:hypothetical protein [Reinekea marina]MDN3649167.1 hypothetical protein [Reinekea marina]